MLLPSPAPSDPAERFSLVVGGPFHAVLRHLGLTGPDRLPTGRAAIGPLLAWLPPALLAVVATQIPLAELVK